MIMHRSLSAKLLRHCLYGFLYDRRILYMGKHYKRKISRLGKHYNSEQLAKERRRFIRRIIYIELVLVLLACLGISAQYNHNVLMKQVESSYAAINTVDESMLGDIAKKAYKETNERIIEEAEEYLWTTEESVYRKGPDDSYDEAGTIENEKMVLRTGTTYNKWSRISIEDEEYYILSDKLTDETPISALIEGGQKGEYQKYALSLFPDYGWSEKELEPLINLWNRESHWNPNAHNRSSGAHGIPQSLPASKMASEGADYYTNGNTQIRWGLKYIAGRYGSPSNAWAFFQSHNSY